MSSAYDTAIAFMRQFHSPQVTIRPSIEAPHLVVNLQILMDQCPVLSLIKVQSSDSDGASGSGYG